MTANDFLTTLHTALHDPSIRNEIASAEAPAMTLRASR